MYNKEYYCLHYTLTITLNSCTAIVLIVIDYILCVIKIVIIIKASVPTLVATIAETEFWSNSATVVCKPQTPIQEPQ